MLAVIAVIVSALVVLGLLTVRVCAALRGGEQLAGEREAGGAESDQTAVVLPVPVSATWRGCGWGAAKEYRNFQRSGVYAAAAAGVNVAPTVQLAPAANDVVHVPAARSEIRGIRAS